MLKRFAIELQGFVVLSDVGVSTEDVRRWLHSDRRGGGVLQRRTTNLWVIHRCPLRRTYAHRQCLLKHAYLSCISLRVSKPSPCALRMSYTHLLKRYSYKCIFSKVLRYRHFFVALDHWPRFYQLAMVKET